ncbi:MAG TPA: aldehyde dehydrogenase [Microvirga sp.]|nr:aldehyde dehydrogenase [Microvirga sp.]
MTRPKTRADWEAKARALKIEGRAFIDGTYVEARSGKRFARISPIDGQVVAEVAECGADDVHAAVLAARRAFENGRWRDLDPRERKHGMLRFASLIRDNLEELALLETLDTGRPIRDALAVDVPFVADCIQYYAEFADKMVDEVAPTGPNDLALIRREPLGVIGAIVPWNYPLIITGWKIGPALVTGNSVVLKPAEQSPLSAIKLAQLAHEAGIPPGVFNVVPGFGESAGKPLALHPDVDMVTFTGSTEVGKLMLRYAADSNMKRVSLECGGKSPVVILADCPDVDAAAEAVAWGIFYNQGETCHASSRVIVHRSVRERFVEAVKAKVAAQIPQGHPLDPSTAMGALIEEKHMVRVLDYIRIGQEEGAKVVLGGNRVMSETGGFYVAPTVLDGVSNTMRVAQEEIFGPVLVVVPFDDEDEALRLANDTIYGLAAAVWTSDMSKANRFSRALKAGTVWINTYDRSSLATPFGGFKQSGFGRDRSPHALDKYTDLKTVWTAFR